MTALRSIPPVSVDSLPEYPVDPDARLDSHEFLRWEFGRWMASDMRWNGSHECKSIWFELLNLSHMETPVGTLPSDPKRLSRMVQPAVDFHHFESLCELTYGPLHGWQMCRCGDEVRLMHPVVTRIVQLAFASRANHTARVEAASQSRRLKRLTEDVMTMSKDCAEDPARIRFIDMVIHDRIAARGGERRTSEDLHFAVQACIEKARNGGFPDKSRQ